jgi:hypothetical protein
LSANYHLLISMEPLAMTIYRITLAEGWHQIVETGDNGSVAVIGCFRTDADALAWLSIYVRNPAKGVFKVGFPERASQQMITAKDRTAVLASV